MTLTKYLIGKDFKPQDPVTVSSLSALPTSFVLNLMATALVSYENSGFAWGKQPLNPVWPAGSPSYGRTPLTYI